MILLILPTYITIPFNMTVLLITSLYKYRRIKSNQKKITEELIEILNSDDFDDISHFIYSIAIKNTDDLFVMDLDLAMSWLYTNKPHLHSKQSSYMFWLERVTFSLRTKEEILNQGLMIIIVKNTWLNGHAPSDMMYGMRSDCVSRLKHKWNEYGHLIWVLLFLYKTIFVLINSKNGLLLQALTSSGLISLVMIKKDLVMENERMLTIISILCVMTCIMTPIIIIPFLIYWISHKMLHPFGNWLRLTDLLRFTTSETSVEGLIKSFLGIFFEISFIWTVWFLKTGNYWNVFYDDNEKKNLELSLLDFSVI